MSTPPERLPKLTEIIEVAKGDAGAQAQAVAARLAAARAAQSAPPSEDDLNQRILAEVQRQVDVMLETRMREALAPALARLTDALVREARAELASTLRDVVARAVAQELSRHRSR
jgi:hypothetical protein